MIWDCGTLRYCDAYQLQQRFVEQCRAGEVCDTVLILEHTPVITFGARASANKMLRPNEELKREGIDLVEIRRGGGVTAHNPGQLVFYPIMNLRKMNLAASDYVHKLEQIGIELLAVFDADAKVKKGFPGLWIGERKVASIGVRVSKGVSFHGMAINVNNDLSIFENMVPCGLDGVTMTSVARELGSEIDMVKMKRELARLLAEHFCSDGKWNYEKYGQTS